MEGIASARGGKGGPWCAVGRALCALVAGDTTWDDPTRGQVACTVQLQAIEDLMLETCSRAAGKARRKYWFRTCIVLFYVPDHYGRSLLPEAPSGGLIENNEKCRSVFFLNQY